MAQIPARFLKAVVSLGWINPRRQSQAASGTHVAALYGVLVRIPY